MKRLLSMLALSTVIGAGCGPAKTPVAPTPSPSADVIPGQEPLDMPGVPYGTYKRSVNDIEKAKQAEQNWQQHIQQ